MIPFAAQELRASFANVSLRERKAIVLPSEFDALRWDDLDYLGWRDPKLPEVGYVVAQLDDGPAGVLLRQSAGRTQSRPQCSWCEDVTLPNDVVYFTAKRTGAAGRSGNTVATLLCSNFECSSNVRKLPPVAYPGFDREAAKLKRIETLQLRARTFIEGIRDGA